MKKLFVALLVLCMLGAGVLYWLMQAVPAPNPLAAQGEPKSESEVPAGEVGHGESDKHGEPDKPGEEGHEGAAGHGEEKAEAGAHEKSAEQDKPAVVTLEIVTEPVHAEVYVDGAHSGTTPTDLKLDPTAREIVVKAEGFEEYKREAPAPSEASGPITWKIQLKALKGQLKAPPHKKAKAESKPAPKTSHAEKKPEVKVVEAVDAVERESDDLTLHGSSKGFYLQLESLAADVSDAQVTAKVQAHRAASGASVYACRVDLMAKGKWTRLLAGPYETKGKAAQALAALQNKIPEGSFVTGGQPCL